MLHSLSKSIRFSPSSRRRACQIQDHIREDFKITYSNLKELEYKLGPRAAEQVRLQLRKKTNSSIQEYKDLMNRTEHKYAQLLDLAIHDGLIDWWVFEGITFILAERCVYTPDFFVFRAGVIEVHEVKGPHVWEDSLIKFKCASAINPEITFVWAKYYKNRGNEFFITRWVSGKCFPTFWSHYTPELKLIPVTKLGA